jgi:hydrogenase nickel incorporation protein HypA/HybF
MHEYSVVRSLLNQVATIAGPRRESRVSKVQLAVGEFAGVDVQLLEFAFIELAPQSLPGHVQLAVRRVPLQAECNQCKLTFPIEFFRFVCPECGDTGIKVVSGEELMLESVTMEEGP